MQIVSWNVNGLRAAVGKNFLEEVKTSHADIFCIQETKAQDDQVSGVLSALKDYRVFSNSAERKGYSGVAILTQLKPLEVIRGMGKDDHDQEGRLLTLVFEEFILVNVYVPNSGNGLKRLDYRAIWDKDFAQFLYELRKAKPVIVTGDFNVAHQEIDLARPKDNYNKTAGYTQMEIDGMDEILNKGFIDSFRHMHPDKTQYSFWSMRMSAREKNIGWRLDYFLVDEALIGEVRKSEIYDQVKGSDHCPVALHL
ncbi:MAG TPA: exodeoxyribonuclease III [Saprospiraceae bacterium]|nr:exodeoxyribonuclease III [Saprospiraceae bacterium]